MNKHYRFTYKKNGGGKLKIVSVWAESEKDALHQAPSIISPGWFMYGFLGEVEPSRNPLQLVKP